LRDRYFALAGRTLELVAAPKLVARDFLVAVGADVFDFSHNVRLLTSFQFLRPSGVSQRGRSGIFTTLPGIPVKKMCIVRTRPWQNIN
jgi:hypothetical protein